MALTGSAWAHDRQESDVEPSHVIEVKAADSETRSAIANLGFAIDEVLSDKVYIYGKPSDAKRLQDAGFKTSAFELQKSWLQWSESATDAKEKYRSYGEVAGRMTELARAYPALVTELSIGRSTENRNMPLMRISGVSAGDAETNKLPVVFFMGCHHAREHLSVETPLRFMEYLLDQYGKNPDVTRLVDSREIYIAPIINPDGYIYDKKPAGGGRLWRKNRRQNSDGTFGVDLNRNYGFHWGTGGSSTDTSSEVYMGTEPFSEVEARNVRDFVRSQPRMRVLLTFHTFSELVLYPWGHTRDQIGDHIGTKEDFAIYSKMANDMAAWNHYKPEQSSDLYIASGDTTDWSYGELGIFSFTFELTPKSQFNGGFYPEPTVIQPTFEANLKPMMYMLEFANDPKRVLTEKIPNFLDTPSRRGIALASFGDLQF